MRILSKILTSRLKPCLHVIISDKQSAFFEGMLLTDNALIAFEINHYKEVHDGVAGLKVDVSKAYDRLEWYYLEHMLIRFGFPDIWIHRVMQCVKTVS